MLKNITEKEWSIILNMRKEFNYELHLKTYEETLDQWRFCLAQLRFNKFLLSCGAQNVNIDYVKLKIKLDSEKLIQLGNELDYLRKEKNM